MYILYGLYYIQDHTSDVSTTRWAAGACANAALLTNLLTGGAEISSNRCLPLQ